MEFRIGEMAALFTAICWTVSAMAFESASRKVGSVVVNLIRLVMAFLLISVFTLISRNMLLPLDATTFNWFWLLLSGLVGFVFGDLFLFKAFTVIGSRYSMLIMTLVPPMAAFTGWIFLGERLSWIHLLGMTVTLSGISLVLFFRKDKNQTGISKLPLKGIVFALGGAAGQAIGLVLSKHGMAGYDPFAATQIRIIAGIIGFAFMVLMMKRWLAVRDASANQRAMGLMLLGATFGPFLGVSSSLLAVQNTATGIASTIMAITPILIIPPTLIFFKQKVNWLEIVGAFISVCGVALFFI
ncbi:MAG TPA: DMT family transporter [Bacteroidales bacterium]|nr:DMT family transporter [Bacteroidales bacterium]